jgi:hypothetical protein
MIDLILTREKHHLAFTVNGKAFTALLSLLPIAKSCDQHILYYCEFNRKRVARELLKFLFKKRATVQFVGISQLLGIATKEELDKVLASLK